jgi:diacylglycerol kinase (ATP)
MTGSELTPEYVLIQRNPSSGTGRGRKQIRILIRELKRSGFRVRGFASRRRLNDWIRRHRDSRRVRCIVAAGGDGTVADVSNRFPTIPVAVLPLGTENLLAKFLGIPRCGQTLAGMIHRGNIQRVDTMLLQSAPAAVNARGHANFVPADTADTDTQPADTLLTDTSHRCLLMTSVGIDAEVVRILHSHRKGTISKLSYLRPILKAFCSYRTKRIHVDADGGEQIGSGTHVIVTNIPAYGFQFPFAPEASCEDGCLDVRIFTGTSAWDALVHALQVWFRFPAAERKVIRFRCRQVKLTSEDSISGGMTPVVHDRSVVSVPVQCDGDPGPDLPVQVSVVPESLQLIVP